MTFTEENYIKAIFHIANENKAIKEVGTNELAMHLNVKPATVNNMLKKLKEKGLIDYEKYKKITLTKSGKQQAIFLIRKHRLWETFLHEKLDFTWDEVHEVAEELEHINSEKLFKKLEAYLDYPQFDPHGDPIPNEKGIFPKSEKISLLDATVGKTFTIVSVNDLDTDFLQYVAELGIEINSKIKIKSRQSFDQSTVIVVHKIEHSVSKEFAENVFVKL